MRIAGIIAEYDPFHKGHAAHIAATRAENGGQATHIVAVISGNFTQRGEPALINKFYRTEMALAAGADLVLELPLPWAMAPAEPFAAGGIAILKGLGCVDLLSFGSECGDVETLKKLANLSDSPDFHNALKKYLSYGIPYAAAGQAAATSLLGEDIADALASPNNTLGIEYLRAIQRQEANFDTFTLLRQGTLHNESSPNQGFASASLIRSLIMDGNTNEALSYMPDGTQAILEQAIKNNEAPADKQKLEQVIPALLRRMTQDDVATLPYLSEGLENRLYNFSRATNNFNDLLEQLKTRRYPLARLRRVLWSALIGLTAKDTLGLPPYIRVLGMNSRGREILAVAKPTLPIITRVAQFRDLNAYCQRIFSLECTATDLYGLTLPQPAACGAEQRQKLIVIK